MSEHETIININNSDLKDGYFVVGTSKESHYNKILKRVGEINVIEVRTSISFGKIVWWHIKIKKSALAANLCCKLVNPDRVKSVFKVKSA